MMSGREGVLTKTKNCWRKFKDFLWKKKLLSVFTGKHSMFSSTLFHCEQCSFVHKLFCNLDLSQLVIFLALKTHINFSLFSCFSTTTHFAFASLDNPNDRRKVVCNLPLGLPMLWIFGCVDIYEREQENTKLILYFIFHSGHRERNSFVEMMCVASIYKFLSLAIKRISSTCLIFTRCCAVSSFCAGKEQRSWDTKERKKDFLV